MKKYQITYILLTLLLLLSGCAPAPVAAPLPIETVFAATHAALMAQTAAAMPKESATPTLAPTLRPTQTLAPTSTFVVLAPTNTPTATIVPTATNVTSGSGEVVYSCEILNLSPKNGYVVKPKEKIIWEWEVKNIGTRKWWSDAVMVTYSRGASFHNNKKYFLDSPTDIGETGTFRVKMEAPTAPGKYTTTWSMRKGIHYFCYAQFQIVVKK
jgi:hypothetical protein